MNPSATRPLFDSLSGGATADSEVLAKKRKIDEDIKNLYEDFGTVIDDYEETEYGEEDYEEEKYHEEEEGDHDEEEDYEEDYHCSDLECSSEDGSNCEYCNGEVEYQREVEEEAEEEDCEEVEEEEYDYYSDEDYGRGVNEDRVDKVHDEEKGNERDLSNDKHGMENVKDLAAEKETVKENEELTWHPLFKPDAPTVVLLSNDGQKLSVDRHLLSSHSEVFHDLFSLPASDLNVDQSQPIFIDEKAEVLAAMLSDIQEHDIRIGLASRKDHNLAFNYAVLRSHDKFQVPDARRAAERRLQSNLEQDPFAGFAIASQHDDLHLGRMAIKLIDLQVGVGGRLDFWKRISDAKPSWQLALAQLVMPFISRYHDKPPPAGVKSVAISYHAAVKTDLRDIAAAFNPRD